MSRDNLVLFPASPWASFDVDRLSHELQGAGFLGDQRSDHAGDLIHRRETYFNTGSNFLRLVEFHHSHGVIVLEDTGWGLAPQYEMDSRESCYIGLETSDRVEFLGNALTKPPGCPHCGLEIAGWIELVSEFYADQPHLIWHCPRCAFSGELYELDWKNYAAFIRFCMNIYDVKDGEARPASALLGLLQAHTQVEWSYCYLRI